jgi:hypothetical protein
MLLLGLAHLLYTFRGPMLRPRDPALVAKMMADSPGISSETTMWRAWMGFNVSHSLCLILFGAVYGYLAIRHSAFLLQSKFLLALGFAVLVSFVVLARVYWFTAPLRGVALATALYVFGIIIGWK